MATDEDLFKNLRDKVSDKSVRGYQLRADMLKRAARRKTLTSTITGNVTRSFNALCNAYKDVTTLRNILTMVLSVYGHSPEFAKQHALAHEYWMARHRELSQVEKHENGNNVMTDAMRDKMATQEEMANALEYLLPHLSNPRRSQQYLLIRLYKDHPPKRLDYGSLRVYKRAPQDAPGNYIIVPPRGVVTLVLQEYKTAKSMGMFTEKIPVGISNDIRASLQQHPREYLFTGRGGAPMSDAAYGMYVRRTFQELTGKNAGVSALRHAYITANCNPATTTVQELDNTAHSMLHSPAMQRQYHIVTGSPPA